MSTQFEFDTEYSADAVEFCPIEGYQEWLLIGTYQLQKDESKVGRIALMEDTGKVADQYETSAVLDIKFSHQLYSNQAVFGAATSQGQFLLCGIENQRIQLMQELNVGSGLCLSLDWQNRVGGGDQVCISSSDGSIHLLGPSPTGFVVNSTYQGHGFEAWIAAFDYHNPSVFYSGGDDCLFKVWDKRMDSCSLTNKVHEAGVTTISSHPLVPHLLSTGSYDEQIRIWDSRQLRQPLSSIATGGGVWRLKWHPTDPSRLLAACMYNGFHLFDYNKETHSLEHKLEYMKHASIAYGADWSYRHENLIGTASFYDHYFTLWST
jgi:diphthamide biosynthesis protein 7